MIRRFIAACLICLGLVPAAFSQALAQSNTGIIPSLNVLGNPGVNPGAATAFPIFATGNAWTALQTFNAGAALNQNITGTLSAVQPTWVGPTIFTYNYNAMTLNTNSSMFLVNTNVNGSAANVTSALAIYGITSFMNINQQASGSTASYTALGGVVFANQSITSPSGSGGIAGVNGNVIILANVTGFPAIVGGEFDVAVRGGATVINKLGVVAALGPDDLVQGSGFDAAFVTYAVPPVTGGPSPGWKYGYLIDTQNFGAKTIDSTIGIAFGLRGAQTANIGLDLSPGTFVTCSIKAPGSLCVDTFGNITTNGFFVSASATSIPAGGLAGEGFTLFSTRVGMFAGSGAPTLSAARGSIYLRSDLLPYYNTNGTTGWDQLVGLTAAQTLTNKSITALTVTGSFTATGLVTNADLVSPTVTVNTVACTLGSSCTIAAAASLVAGSSTVTGTCTSGFLLFNNAGVLGCQASAGGGNVSNSGTPTAGQMAQWVTATTIQGIAVTGTGSAVLATAPTMSSVTVTTAFTATGLVTNADLVNASTTVNTVTCTLGASCTVTAAAGTLTGATLAAGVTASSLTSVGTLTALAIAGNLTTNVTGGGTQCLQASNTGVVSGTGSACGSGSGAVNSVTNADGTLTISPTTGAVVASIALGHVNTWTAAQTFSGGVSISTSFTATGLVGLASLAVEAANTVVGNATSGSASPTALAVGSCSTAASALTWTTNTGFGCNTAITAAAMAASGLTGQVALGNGGTNANLTASNGGIVYSTASALAILSGTATANLPLLSGATAAPTWATVAYLTSATSGGVAYFSSTTQLASSALLGTGCIIAGGGAGNPPITATATCPTIDSTTGIVTIANVTDSTTATSGALLVSGGVGIVKSVTATGTFHTFGSTANTSSVINVVGPAASTNGGSYITVVNGGSNIFLLGNRSAVFGPGNGGLAYDATPIIYANSDLLVYRFSITPANYSTRTTTFATAASSGITGTFQVQGGIAASAASWIAAQLTVSTGAAGISLTLTNTAGSCTHTPTAGSETVSCSSDERLKYGIVDAAPVLNDLMQVRVRDYLVRADNSLQTGVIAQEMASVNPAYVHIDANDSFTVDAPNPWKLLKAIQELKADNDNLRAELEALKTGTK